MRLLISEAQIAEKVAEVAASLNKQGKPLTLVVILKGAVCFASDLIRKLEIPFELEFVSAKSYGMRGTEPGSLAVAGIENLQIQGKEVLLIDDICDTGTTLARAYSELEALGPKSIDTLVLLDKRTSHPRSFKPDQSGFEIEDLFVVGYGLDYKEQYRGLQGIFVFEDAD